MIARISTFQRLKMDAAIDAAQSNQSLHTLRTVLKFDRVNRPRFALKIKSKTYHKHNWMEIIIKNDSHNLDKFISNANTQLLFMSDWLKPFCSLDPFVSLPFVWLCDWISCGKMNWIEKHMNPKQIQQMNRAQMQTTSNLITHSYLFRRHFCDYFNKNSMALL